MATSTDFKATVLAHLDRLGDLKMFRRGEAFLLGQDASGRWTRLRIPRRYSFLQGVMVRVFVERRHIARLAILSPADFQQGQPQRLRLVCVEHDRVQHETLEAPLVDVDRKRVVPGSWVLVPGGGQDPLVDAARHEWSHAPPHPRSLAATPWPINLLVVILVLEAAFAS